MTWRSCARRDRPHLKLENCLLPLSLVGMILNVPGSRSCRKNSPAWTFTFLGSRHSFSSRANRSSSLSCAWYTEEQVRSEAADRLSSWDTCHNSDPGRHSIVVALRSGGSCWPVVLRTMSLACESTCHTLYLLLVMPITVKCRADQHMSERHAELGGCGPCMIVVTRYEIRWERNHHTQIILEE